MACIPTIPNVIAVAIGQCERTLTCLTEKVTTVCLRLCSVSQDDGFCGEDDLFSGEDDRFLAKTKDFLFFFVFAKNPLSSPMFTLHTYEWSNYTEHVRTY